ncbi:MAG: cohesin domain-containing protein [Bacteroidales bacterium]
MKIIKIVCFSLLVFYLNHGKAQTFSMDNVKACIGDTVGIPINMPHIDSAGAITLFISYDTTSLEFINMTNINLLASGTIFNDMHLGGNTGPRLGKIAISWVANGPDINFNIGTFGVLNFKVIGNSCSINFLGNCEIVNYNTQIININYVNGSLIVPSIPLIVSQPLQLSINTSQTGIFVIDATSADSIKWEMKQGNVWQSIQNNNIFQGVSNDTLYISQPGINLNGTYFRCRLSNLCSTVQSDSVILNVELAINNNTLADFKYFPNPFNDNISIDFPILSNIDEINISLIDGKIIRKIILKEESTHFNLLQLEKLEKGCYFFEIIFQKNKNQKDKKTFKMIKN